MALLSSRRSAAVLSLAGRIARHGRRHAARAGLPGPADAELPGARGRAWARGGWSSLIRLAGGRPSEAPAAPTAWGRWKRPAPVFLCTDFAPSQWFQP